MKEAVGYYNLFKREPKEQKHLWIRNIEMNVQIETILAFSAGWKGRQNLHVYRRDFALLLVIYSALSCKLAS